MKETESECDKYITDKHCLQIQQFSFNLKFKQENIIRVNVEIEEILLVLRSVVAVV
jgi:hypothetical protein